ncbi:prolipoprotein diacylglyceryl transferase [Yunchengibacter salinarum]|uniref:prolipoprotein diacylglyceryl transferase n=1 Tax=Yunchengibacter salinarum TaxID=3133399 RepID=UPI0035B5BBB1
MSVFADAIASLSALLPVAVLTFPDIGPVMVEIGPVPIRYYSLAYILALLIGWWFVRRQAATPDAPISRTQVDDLLTWAMLGVIAGGRIGYVLFYNLGHYLDHPSQILRLWDGGMSFHGGFLGVVLALILFCRKHALALWRVGDRVAVIAPVGLFLGRLANFINGELWGRPSDVPWAMVFPADPAALPRHPSQLYEAGLEGLLLFAVLIGLYRLTGLARRAPGALVGVFVAGYGTARFIVEFFRAPDSHLGLSLGLSQGQWLSLPMVAVGVLLWVAAHAHRLPAPRQSRKG